MIIKVYYSVIIALCIAAIVLSAKILMLQEIPDQDMFRIHISSLKRGIQKMRTDSENHYARAKESLNNTQNPTVLRAMAALDSVMAFRDSADFYFRKIGSFKNNTDSVRQYLSKYRQFYKGFSKAIRNNTSLEIKNYLFDIDDKLPGNRLPLDSSQGIELDALLLEAEFYETMVRVLYRIAAFG